MSPDARDPVPPRFLEAIVARALPRGLSGDAALGDLAEGYADRARSSPVRARLWYAAQAASIVGYRLLTGRGDEPGGDSDLAMDVRWSVRTVLCRPGYAIGVVGVLGLGIGAVVGVYAVVDGTLRNTSWWAEPDRTVAVWPERGFSFGQIEMWQEEETAFRALGGWVELAYAVRTPDGESESVVGAFLSPQLFRELAVQPALGRALAEEDALFGAEPVVVIGEALWRRSLGADPGIVGSRIEVSGVPRTVVGVQGPGGVAPGGRTELWVPLTVDPRDDDFWRAQSYTVVGVLRDGATVEDADAALMAFSDRLSRLFPMFYPEGWAEPEGYVELADTTWRELVATPLLLLFGGTALLLLLTALNVGNLQLGRAIGRRQELALRSSLGASRGRVARQLVVEGGFLTLLALAVGAFIAVTGADAVVRLFVEEPTVARASLFARDVLLFGLSVALVAWVVVAGIPVAHFLRTQRGGLTVSPTSGAPVQRTLVAVQAALATLLLVSASLLVATVDNLRDVPLGFEPDGIVTVELSPPENRVASPIVARELYDALVREVEAIPGVTAAGLTGWLPLRREAPPTPVNERDAPVDPREARRIPMQMVDPGFFDALGVQSVSGRLLGSEDRATAAPSAIVVNQTMADLLWPDGSAVGREIAIDPHAWDLWTPIVGVVPDIRSGGVTGPVGPALYVSLAESPARDVTLVVRGDGSPAALAAEIRSAVRRVDPLVPVRTVATMPDVVRAAYSTAWVMMGLLSVLATLATVLGALGIYAVLAHHVASNRREIGVRIALGAHPSTVVGRVVRSGLVLALLGIAGGSAVAVFSNRWMDELLYGVSAASPWAFVGPAAALAGAAVLAAWVPAARAGRLPPAEVLKSE